MCVLLNALTKINTFLLLTYYDLLDGWNGISKVQTMDKTCYIYDGVLHNFCLRT
jgi:hypothetical protein